jgi:hypothetical protein
VRRAAAKSASTRTSTTAAEIGRYREPGGSLLDGRLVPLVVLPVDDLAVPLHLAVPATAGGSSGSTGTSVSNTAVAPYERVFYWLYGG